MAAHLYNAHLTWTGAADGPAADYKTYARAFTAEIAGKPALPGSADPAFLGDPARHNPEDLLLIALASCHMLSYLALAVRKGLKVLAYEDRAEGAMAFEKGGGQFRDVLLKPLVTVSRGSDLVLAQSLHRDAHAACFIARSVNFPVRHDAQTREA